MLKLIKTLKIRNPKTGKFESFAAIKGDKGVDGKKGDKGDSIHVAYSSYDDGSYYTTEWQPGQIYLGIATGAKQPSDKMAYTWIRLPEGPKGEQGTSANYSSEINYLSDRIAELEMAIRNGGIIPGAPSEPDEPELPDEYCQLNDFEGVDYDEEIGDYRSYVCKCGTSIDYSDYSEGSYYHYPPTPEVHKHSFIVRTANEHECRGCSLIEPHKYALLNMKNSAFHYRSLGCSECSYKKPLPSDGNGDFIRESHTWVELSDGKYCSVCDYKITAVNICNINTFSEVIINDTMYYKCECSELITYENYMNGIFEHSIHEHDWVTNPDNENECICYGCYNTKEHNLGLWKFIEIDSLYHKVGQQCQDCDTVLFSEDAEPNYHTYSYDNGIRCICGREMESDHSHTFKPYDDAPDNGHICMTCGHTDSHNFNSGHDTFKCKCGYELYCIPNPDTDYDRIDLDNDQYGETNYYYYECKLCGYRINGYDFDHDLVSEKYKHVKVNHVHAFNYNKNSTHHHCACGAKQEHNLKLDGVFNVCTICEYVAEELCPSSSFTQNKSGVYICDLCGYASVNIPSSHYRQVTGLNPCPGTSYTPVTSGYKCTTCGAIVQNRGDAHLPGDIPVDKICDHTVGTKTVNYSSIDEHEHAYDVVCANDKCGYKIATATEGHNYTDGICELCDHQCGHADQGYVYLELGSDDPQRDTYHVFITHCEICNYTVSEVHEPHSLDGLICSACNYNSCTHSGETRDEYDNIGNDHIVRTYCCDCGKICGGATENHYFSPYNAYKCVCGAQNCIHYNDEGSFINVNITANNDGGTHTYEAKCHQCDAIVDTTVDDCDFHNGYCTICGQPSICQINNFTAVSGANGVEYQCECGAVIGYADYMNGNKSHTYGG